MKTMQEMSCNQSNQACVSALSHPVCHDRQVSLAHVNTAKQLHEQDGCVGCHIKGFPIFCEGVI
jgi:CxxC motif-containing protein (DUF1111 family)